MSTEYRYINFKDRKVLDLCAAFHGGSVWSRIFDDFVKLRECYSVDELFQIITEESRTDTVNEHTADELRKCAVKIHEFLSTGDPTGYAMYCDSGWTAFVDRSLEGNSSAENMVHNIGFSAENVVWCRWEGLMPTIHGKQP